MDGNIEALVFCYGSGNPSGGNVDQDTFRG